MPIFALISFAKSISFGICSSFIFGIQTGAKRTSILFFIAYFAISFSFSMLYVSFPANSFACFLSKVCIDKLILSAEFFILSIFSFVRVNPFVCSDKNFTS